MTYIHSKGVIHRDIKPENLMITPDPTLKIADFGCAIKLDEFSGSDIINTIAGTPAFHCPEISALKKEYSGFKSDIWASGITLYYLVTGNYPFLNCENQFQLKEKIIKEEIQIPNYVDESLADLIKGMLEKDESKRFSISQIKNHKWFTTKLGEKKPETSYLVDRWKSFTLLPYIAKALNINDHVNSTTPSQEIKRDDQECITM